MVWNWFKRREDETIEESDVTPHPFAETMDLEVRGWCYGLHNLNQPLESRVVYRVIGEMAPVMLEAIKQGYEFDLVDLAIRLSAASNNIVPAKEAVFYFLANLPNPATLDSEQRQTVGAIIRSVEVDHEGAVRRCCERWKLTVPHPTGPSAQSLSSSVVSARTKQDSTHLAPPMGRLLLPPVPDAPK